MGWSSAVDIFDGVVDVALKYAPTITNLDTHTRYNDDETILRVVRDMYTKVDWEDWDTQDESKYAEFLRTVRTELGEIEICPVCGDTENNFSKYYRKCYSCGYEVEDSS